MTNPLAFFLRSVLDDAECQMRLEKLNRLWDEVILCPDAEQLLALGRCLVENGFELLLKNWRLSIYRLLLVSSRTALPGESQCLATIAILELACADKRRELTDILNPSNACPPQPQLDFQTARNYLMSLVTFDTLLFTPHVTRPELIAFMAGCVPGMSKGNLSKQVAGGRLMCSDPIGSGKKGRGVFARYHHHDPAVNFPMMKAVHVGVENSAK